MNLFLYSNATILPPMSMKENTQKAAYDVYILANFFAIQ